MNASGPGDEALRRVVAAVFERRTAITPAVEAVAADMPGAPGERWRRVAGALGGGDVARALVPAAADPAAWVALVPARGDDEAAMLRRLLAEVREPTRRAAGAWWPLAYPLIVAAGALAVLWLLGATVMPAFQAMFMDFGIRMPLLTRLAFAVATGFGGKVLVLVIAGLVLFVCGMLLRRYSLRGPVVTAAFMRALAALAGAGLPDDEAVALAARCVKARGVALPAGDRAPTPPLSAAAMTALAAPAAAREKLLAALAACHGDRDRAALGALEWLIGPIAVGMVGMLVLAVVLALFMPLISLVSSLS